MIIGVIWIVWLSLLCFILGSMIGSFLNVCIHRLPRGKSLLFPGSHCGACGTAIHLSDNIPLFSYWILGGRCRSCGVTFSLRYFWVELALAVAFLLVFLLEVVANVNRIHRFGSTGYDALMLLRFPPDTPLYYLIRVIMLAWLATCFWIALERNRVPVSVWLSGCLLAILIGALFPWPWPDGVLFGVAPPEQRKNWVIIDSFSTRDDPYHWMKPSRHTTMALESNQSWSLAPASPRLGLQPWPFWGPIPEIVQPSISKPSPSQSGDFRLGLATVIVGLLAGGLVGSVMARLGLPGFVPLMVLAGGFLGWQPLVIPLAVVLIGWLLVLPARLFPHANDCLDTLRELPGLGVASAWFGWPWLSTLLYPILFDARVVLGLVGLLILIQILPASRSATSDAVGVTIDAGSP